MYAQPVVAVADLGRAELERHARGVHSLRTAAESRRPACAVARAPSTNPLINHTHTQPTHALHHTPLSSPLTPTPPPQARQAALQRAQAARGFSYLLGKSDRLVSVAAPSALLGAALFMLVGGAAQMYTKPGSN